MLFLSVRVRAYFSSVRMLGHVLLFKRYMPLFIALKNNLGHKKQEEPMEYACAETHAFPRVLYISLYERSKSALVDFPVV